MEQNKIVPNTLTAEDRAIMETSNDALLTKMYDIQIYWLNYINYFSYASQLGYFKDDYSKEFGKNKKKF